MRLGHHRCEGMLLQQSLGDGHQIIVHIDLAGDERHITQAIDDQAGAPFRVPVEEAVRRLVGAPMELASTLVRGNDIGGEFSVHSSDPWAARAWRDARIARAMAATPALRLGLLVDSGV